MTTGSDTVIGTQEVRFQKSGRVGTITIARPHRRNTVNRRVAMEIYHVVEQASRDEELAVLVFRGEGRDFCCGADVVPEGADTPAATDEVDMRQFDVSKLLYGMRAVTIAAVRGGCAGAGMAWACCCDFRIADANVKFNTAFLDVGVAGDMGLPWTLTRLIGSARARELCFFPRKIGAQEALELGLVTRVYPDETFEGELEAMAGRIAASAPLAVATLKANFVDAERTTLDDFIDLESVRHIALFYTEDRVEAFSAYLEKRAPMFSGR
jgi:2-(1,2-epoxy-1,2-dihydrophenyl)acetyl-CoA isomerase